MSKLTFALTENLLAATVVGKSAQYETVSFEFTGLTFVDGTGYTCQVWDKTLAVLLADQNEYTTDGTTLTMSLDYATTQMANYITSRDGSKQAYVTLWNADTKDLLCKQLIVIEFALNADGVTVTTLPDPVSGYAAQAQASALAAAASATASAASATASAASATSADADATLAEGYRDDIKNLVWYDVTGDLSSGAITLAYTFSTYAQTLDLTAEATLTITDLTGFTATNAEALLLRIKTTSATGLAVTFPANTILPSGSVALAAAGYLNVLFKLGGDGNLVAKYYTEITP